MGDLLGHYRLLDQIGAGGMGVVYRARDERIDRDVALKLVPAHLLEDENSRKRFRQEARTLSRLSHPNIAALFEFDTEGDTDFLVMELVQGVSLRAKVTGGPVPSKELYSLAAQLAAGLAAAHNAGIVHRDLKPDNIVVTTDGLLKILDFGLATLTPEASLDAATITSMANEQGSAAGTLLYMAPEQLRGEAADARSDIYSAGAVLYEMTTGRAPFEQRGPLLVDAVLNRDPQPVAKLNPRVPAALAAIVEKAMDKDPERRYQSARELGVDIQRLSYATSRHEIPVGLPQRKSKGIWLIPVLAGVALVAAFGGWYATRSKPPVGPENYVALTNFADSATSPALSPDGKMLAFIRGESTFITRGDLYLKLLPDGEPKALTHDGTPKAFPAFSPNGDVIAYFDKGAVSTVPLLGGTPRQLLANADGLHWIDRGRLMFSEYRGHGLHMGVVTSDESRNGVRDVYIPEDVNGMAHRSALSPDKKWVLIVEMDISGWLPCRVVPFDGTSRGRPIGTPGSQCTSAAWSPDGKWMYFSANTGDGFHIWRQGFPNGALEQVTFGASDEQGIAFDPGGKSFVTSIGTSQSTIWIHDKKGDRQISSEGFAFMPSFSRDGRKLYYLVRSGPSRHFVSGELREADLATGDDRVLLKGFTMEHYDVSDDGRQVLFVATDAAGKSPVWLAMIDGSSPPRKLTEIDSVRAVFGHHNDAYFVGGERGSPHLYHILLDGSGLTQVLSAPVTYLYSISPDGKWLAIWVGLALRVVSVDGTRQLQICDPCATAGGEDRGITPPMVSWSRDQRFVYLHLPILSRETIALPLQAGEILPPIPAAGIKNVAEAQRVRPGRVLSQERAFAGADPSTFVYPRVTTHRNIYRVPVR